MTQCPDSSLSVRQFACSLPAIAARALDLAVRERSAQRATAESDRTADLAERSQLFPGANFCRPLLSVPRYLILPARKSNLGAPMCGSPFSQGPK